MAVLAVGLTLAAFAPLKADAPPPANTAADQNVARRFPTLDAYLAWLEKQSQLDRAWYREVRPGLYELQPGNLRLDDQQDRQRLFTRQELERKFGFAK